MSTKLVEKFISLTDSSFPGSFSLHHSYHSTIHLHTGINGPKAPCTIYCMFRCLKYQVPWKHILYTHTHTYYTDIIFYALSFKPRQSSTVLCIPVCASLFCSLSTIKHPPETQNIFRMNLTVSFKCGFFFFLLKVTLIQGLGWWDMVLNMTKLISLCTEIYVCVGTSPLKKGNVMCSTAKEVH